MIPWTVSKDSIYLRNLKNYVFKLHFDMYYCGGALKENHS
jgi:hypothetical protein